MRIWRNKGTEGDVKGEDGVCTGTGNVRKRVEERAEESTKKKKEWKGRK